MSSSGFEPPIPAIKQAQTYALDRAATGIGKQGIILVLCPKYVLVARHNDLKHSGQFVYSVLTTDRGRLLHASRGVLGWGHKVGDWQ
jgi:hypothetical protein